MVYIKREVDELITKWFDENEKNALMIFGARQVGKTESIRSFIRNKFEIDNDDLLPEINIVINQEARDIILNNRVMGEYSLIESLFIQVKPQIDLENSKVLFIDEIQALSNLKREQSDPVIIKAIKSILKDNKYKIIFSGSMLGTKLFNLDNENNELSKDIQFVHMFPLTFMEFIEFLDGNKKAILEAKNSFSLNKVLEVDMHTHLLKRLAEFSYVGGMPVAVLTYSEGFDANKSHESILNLIDGYKEDISKYYREEYDEEGVKDFVFDYLLDGFNHQDKQKYMKRLNEQERRKFYNFIAYSDVGLVVPHIDEINKKIEIQKSPKTYFNDVGLLRCLENRKAINLNHMKEALISTIETGKKNTNLDNNGKYFEQLIAQELKARNFEYAYFYSKLNSNELEFIIDAANTKTALEIKSGDFHDFKSIKNYVLSGNSGLLSSIYPYLGEYETNLNFIPLYDLCFLNEADLCNHKFEKLNNLCSIVIGSGRLPNNIGFFNNEEKVN